MTRHGRSLLIGLVAGLTIGLVSTPVFAATPVSGQFIDDDGHPGEVYFEWLAAIGVAETCDPPTGARICPDDTLDRAEAARILVVTARAVGRIPPALSSLIRVFSGCQPATNRWYCADGPITRSQAAWMLVGVFGLKAPTFFGSPWTDTEGSIYEEPARVAAYNDLWDSSLGQFSGSEEIDRAEFARALVVAATGDDPCPASPFTAVRVDSLGDRFLGQTFTAYAYDTRTGCAYWMHPDLRLRTASVFKVLVMAGTLLEAQEAGRPVSSREWSELVPMITESANNPVRALWRSFGGSPWFTRQSEIYAMSQTTPVGDTERVWGRTTTSAKDQADLLRQVLRGEWGPLEEAYRSQALELMTSVVPSQTWGVTEGVPSGWTVAQKNGFAGHIANSVGFVRQPGGDEGYVVTVLSNGWSNWTRGVPVVSEISGWVSERLAS